MKASLVRNRIYRPSQGGFTLIELLVAMAVGMLVVLAALAALLVARTGFANVDAASQLRDNGRFVSLLIDRLAVQSGFRDVQVVAGQPVSVPPAITGFSNAKPRLDDLTQATALTSTNAGYGSDVLIMRFQPVGLNPMSREAGLPTDQAMIDCFGFSPNVTSGETDSHVSILSVGADSTGQPALMCSRSNNGLAPYTTSSLVRGVELFKVLYGVDSGVTPNSPPDATAVLDTVPKRYLTAAQMVVDGNTAATEENWRRVRSLRIGMVLRSDVTPADMQRQAITLYPFGPAKSADGGSEGSAFTDAANVNSTFQAPADGRIRQVVTFTVHLRNDQGG